MSNQEQNGSGVTSGLFHWLDKRTAGLLLHPTCLPGDQGVGVLDHSVDALLDFLQSAGIHYWQVCPLGPTGYGDSPYQCFSAFAGNPYLVDLKPLVTAGLLSTDDLIVMRQLPRDRVDYGWLYVTKWPALFKAHAAAAARSFANLPYGDFARFRERHADWIESYALFMALKDQFDGRPWQQWPDAVRFYSKARMQPANPQVAARAEAYAFAQYLFFGQWAEVRAKAAARGIEIIGDAPIFVALDSADVWTHPDLFQIDATTGAPRAVAGVPPDYFSSDGQFWGNPLYDWAAHEADDFAWWRQRLQANLELCDVVRIDHFRAFDTYWSIPAGSATAKTGQWKKGPGLGFFESIKRHLPAARLIAEDLGELFDSVHALRDASGLPGMAILQFAFGGDTDNLYLPHNLAANSVVYPGTHDNNTTLGWYRETDEKTRDHVRRYLRVPGDDIGWDLIRAAYACHSNLAVIPLQDFLGLPAAARFNIPGKPDGNWQWRYQAGQLAELRATGGTYLRALATLYGRRP